MRPRFFRLTAFAAFHATATVVREAVRWRTCKTGLTDELVDEVKLLVRLIVMEFSLAREAKKSHEVLNKT